MTYNENWGKKLRFSEDDLLANQANKLSPQQMLQLNMNTILGAISIVTFGGMFAFVALWMAVDAGILAGLAVFAIDVGLSGTLGYLTYWSFRASRNREILATTSEITFSEIITGGRGQIGLIHTSAGQLWLKTNPVIPIDWYQGKTFKVYYIQTGVLSFLSLEEI